MFREVTCDAARRLMAVWRTAAPTDDQQVGRKSSMSWRAAAENARRAPGGGFVSPPAATRSALPQRHALNAVSPRYSRENGVLSDPQPRQSRRRDRSAARARYAPRSFLPSPAVRQGSGKTADRSDEHHRTDFAAPGRTTLRCPVQPVQLDENGPGLFRTAPPHDRGCAFQVAAADVGRDPDCGFQTHMARLFGRLSMRVLGPRSRHQEPLTYSNALTSSKSHRHDPVGGFASVTAHYSMCREGAVHNWRDATPAAGRSSPQARAPHARTPDR